MKKPKVDIKDIKYYVNIVLMCLLAFAAGYVVSPHMGKYSSFLLLIPIAVASGFVRVNVFAKAAVFASTAGLSSAARSARRCARSARSPATMPPSSYSPKKPYARSRAL